MAENQNYNSIKPYELEQVYKLENMAIKDPDSMFGSGIIIGLTKKIFQLEMEIESKERIVNKNDC